jgi:hypothetical protein
LQVHGPYEMEHHHNLDPLPFVKVPAAHARVPLTQEKA